MYLMELQQLGFKFERIVSGWPEHLATQNYLWIWHADKIPPHIGISANGAYFSLTYKTCEQHLPVDFLSAKANRTAIPIVLVELKSSFSVDELNTVFQAYSEATSNGATCLTPIKNVFQLDESVEKLAHLLTFFSENDLLGNVFGIHLPKDFKGILAYDVDDIRRRIATLHSNKKL